jgi:hypothetical protein
MLTIINYRTLKIYRQKNKYLHILNNETRPRNPNISLKKSAMIKAVQSNLIGRLWDKEKVSL